MLLTASTRSYLQASVPVLREHGAALTRRFYADMFAAQPELKNLFNLGNQANGAQQGSLAAALLAYAANIDRPEALSPVIHRIAHKHASVGIRPAHYPIVARHLLGAMKHVLGSSATPDLLAAWDEAYWLLAGELIAAEARLYDRRGVEAGELQALRVTRRCQESDELVALYLERPAGGSPGSFIPGQYVSVAVDFSGTGLRQLRQYSLSDSPDKPYWRITVRREAGRANAPAGLVSTFLHDRVRAGDVLLVGAPFGNFTPGVAPHERPLALVSAGAGITPMISVLNAHTTGSHRPLLFAHAARSPRHHAHREDLSSARAQLSNLRAHIWYEQDAAPLQQATKTIRAGRMLFGPELIADFREADFYLCGPLDFMRAQWRRLIELGISPAQLHREVFGPELLDHLL